MIFSNSTCQSIQLFYAYLCNVALLRKAFRKTLAILNAHIAITCHVMKPIPLKRNHMLGKMVSRGLFVLRCSWKLRKERTMERIFSLWTILRRRIYSAP